MIRYVARIVQECQEPILWAPENAYCVCGIVGIKAAVVGEVLECSREPTNEADRYAVAVIKNEVAIGHLPRSLTIHCTVTGRRRHSVDLPQGGLDSSLYLNDSSMFT